VTGFTINVTLHNLTNRAVSTRRLVQILISWFVDKNCISLNWSS